MIIVLLILYLGVITLLNVYTIQTFVLPDTQFLKEETLDGPDFFSDSSPLNSANANLVAILALCLVGVGGSALGLGVAFGFGAAFTLTSGLVSGLTSTFLGFGFLPGLAFLPGLLPRDRLRAGRFLTWTICFLTSLALIVNMVPSSYC